MTLTSLVGVNMLCAEKFSVDNITTSQVMMMLVGVNMCCVQALYNLDERALPEWAAFAATLARRLAALLPKQPVSLGDPVWKACVDSFLVKAVDIDSQVCVRQRTLGCGCCLVTVCQACAYDISMVGMLPTPNRMTELKGVCNPRRPSFHDTLCGSLRHLRDAACKRAFAVPPQ